jgi:hypothetical protein
MEEETKDIEAPEATRVEQKGDDLSVDDTKSVSTASDHDSDDSVADVAVKDGNSQDSGKKRIGMIALLTMFVIVIGLGVGLGVGLTNKNSSFSFGWICGNQYESENPSSSGDSVDNAESPELPSEPEYPELPSDPKEPVVGGNDKDIIIGGNDEYMRWPELVGMPGTDAEELLQQWYGDTYVIVPVPLGGHITKDHRTDRIILYLDEAANVMQVPAVG